MSEELIRKIMNGVEELEFVRNYTEEMSCSEHYEDTVRYILREAT